MYFQESLLLIRRSDFSNMKINVNEINVSEILFYMPL